MIGEHLLIADDASAFASSIVESSKTQPSETALGRAGRRLVEARYSWELAGARLEALYRQITGGETGPSMAPELVATDA